MQPGGCLVLSGSRHVGAALLTAADLEDCELHDDRKVVRRDPAGIFFPALFGRLPA